MKKNIFLLLLAGVGVLSVAQAQETVGIAKILKKDASSVKRVSWNTGAHFNGNGTYRIPYRVMRQRVEAPLRGGTEAVGNYFYIKGANKFPDVVCFAGGIVKRSGNGEILIDHGNGFESSYEHIASPAVKVGERVKKGRFIGRLRDDKTLVFGLSVNGSPIDVRTIFDAETGLVTYAGNLYIYKLEDSVFLSKNAPMAEFARKKDQLDEEYVFYYKQAVSAHRAKRDFVDETLKGAKEEEINLEDVQIGPAKKQDTLRVRNNIVL